jgi:hypothetical protein
MPYPARAPGSCAREGECVLEPNARERIRFTAVWQYDALFARSF